MRTRVRPPVLLNALVVWSRVDVTTVPVRARVDLKCCLVLCTSVDVCLSRIGSTCPSLLSRLVNLLWLICITSGVNRSAPVVLSAVLTELTTLQMAANLLWDPILLGPTLVPGLSALCKLGSRSTGNAGPDRPVQLDTLGPPLRAVVVVGRGPRDTLLYMSVGVVSLGVLPSCVVVVHAMSQVLADRVVGLALAVGPTVVLLLPLLLMPMTLLPADLLTSYSPIPTLAMH